MKNNQESQHETPQHNRVPSYLKFSDRQFTEHKTTCDMPGYLFWKIQSHLTKLANQLRRQKLKTTPAPKIDSTATAHKD